MPIPFVGKRFTPEQFEDYLAGVQFTSFKPEFVTLHHTAIPSLKDRPNGFTDAHLKILLDYYGKQLGWSGAPHLFVDDRADGIIVFQRLDKRGVHAVSFNKNSWGVEMLGYYDVEDFDKGRGLKVRDNAMKALALMNKRLGAKPESIKFHRDDPQTKKTCPGMKVRKEDVVAMVRALMHVPTPADVSPDTTTPWSLTVAGKPLVPVHVVDGRPTVRVRPFLDAVSPGGKFALSADRTQVKWTRADNTSVTIPVAELDETGTSWALVRALSDSAGCHLAVNGRNLVVSA